MRWLRFSAKTWLNAFRAFDAYFTYSLDGLCGFRQVLHEFAAFRTPQKAPKPKQFRPTIEALETRQLLNSAPVAYDDGAYIHANHVLDETSVLGNDTDADNDVLSASLVDNVSHGTLTFESDGSYSYTPTPDYVGDDSFTYQASDGSASSNVATVTLHVTNATPVAYNDTLGTHQGDDLSAYNIIALDAFDADTDTLTASKVDDVTHGSLTVYSDGEIDYLPTAGYVGDDSFTFKVYDGLAYSNVATITIHVTNTAPTASNLSFSTKHDTEFGETSVVDIGASDVDHDTLVPSRVDNVTHGTLNFYTGGNFDYTPNAGFVGDDSFTYKVFDGAAFSNTATVTIHVTDIAPVANKDTYSTNIATTLNSPGSVLDNDTDADDDTLTASVVSNVGHGTLSLNSDGTFTYTPATGFMGDDRFTYQAYDGAEYSNTATVIIHVEAVYFSSVSYSVGEAGGTSTITVNLTPASESTVTVQYDTCGCGTDNSPLDDVLAQLDTTLPQTMNPLATDGVDFISTRGFRTLTFAPGQTSKTFTIPILNNSYADGSRDIRLLLTNPVGAGLGTPYRAIDTILDDESSYTFNGDGQPILLVFPDSTSIAWGYTASGQVSSVVDQLGHTTLMSYDASSNLTAIVDPLNQTTGITYNSANLVGSLSRPNLDPTYEYDSSHNITAIVNADSTTQYYAFDSLGNVTSFIDELGHTTTYSYDGFLKTSQVDPLGHTTTYAYDSTGDITATVDPLGHTTTNTYDSNGHVLTTTDPLGHTTTNTYNGAGQIETVVNPLNVTTTYAYDVDGRIESITQPDPDGAGPLTTSVTAYAYTTTSTVVTDPSGGTTIYLYDAHGRLQSTTDPVGNVTTNAYDDAGHLLAPVAPGGLTTTYGYDDAGQVTSVVDPHSGTATMAYDGDGNLTAQVDSLGQTTTYAYDSRDRQTAVIDPLGHTVITVYDAANEVTAMVDANGHTSYTKYDAAGQVTATIDALGKTSYMDYDAAGRMTASVDANGHTTYTDYDAAGQVTATVDALGKTSYTDYDAAGQVTATVDANGKTSYMDYDILGRVTASVDANGHTASQKYDAAGHVTASVDVNGHTSLTAYDVVGNATQTVDGNGHTAHQYYSSSGLLTETIDAGGHTTLFDYDSQRRLTATVDGNGHTSKQIYDSFGNVTASVDANGHTSHQYFDTMGQATASVDANGKTSYQDYDAAGRVTATVDDNGHTSHMYYDPANQMTASVTANGKTSYQDYDADGRVTAAVDGAGKTSYVDYDAIGQATAAVDANGFTSYQRFDANGQVTAIVDANGVTARQYYDPVGNVTESIDYNGATTLLSYDALHQLTQFIDNAGRTAHFAYDNIGNLTQSIDVHGFTTKQSYDADNQVTQSIDVTGHTSTQSYDADGQVTMSIDSVGNTTKALYDADEQVTATVDGRGNTSLTKYDAVGNVTATIDADSNTNLFAYDNDGNNTSVIDPDGNTTTMAFDGNGQLTQTIAPTGSTTLQTYDADGNLTETIAPDGSSIVIGYDADDRETQQVWYDPSHSTVDTQPRTYTNTGQLATAGNINGTYTFAYDHDGRVTSVVEPFAVTLNYAYDGNGNQTQVVDSFGGTQTSVYDLEERLTSRTYTGQSQNLREDFTYNSQGLVATDKRYSDLSGTTLVAETDYGYDANGNTTSIYTSGVQSYTYTYDQAGNLLSQFENGDLSNFTYDYANQLTQTAFLPNGSGTYQNTNYSFDDAGNRDTAGYSTTLGNEMSSDGTWDYQYDDKGNITEKDLIGSSEKWTYGYDNRNELIEAKHYDATSALVLTVDYKYDLFGNRNEQDVTDGVGTTVTRFALDGWNSANPAKVGTENFNVFADLNGSSSLTARYLYGDKTDKLLARIDGTTPRWIVTDRLGSVRDVIDNTGAVKDAISYDAFGNIDTGTETHPNERGRYAFTGREFDVETDLQYNRARYYDATTGRWMSQDPLGFDAGDSNLYRYSRNLAVQADDPSGLFSWRYDGTTLVLNASAHLTFFNSPGTPKARQWTPDRESAFFLAFIRVVNSYFNNNPYTIYPKGTMLRCSYKLDTKTGKETGGFSATPPKGAPTAIPRLNLSITSGGSSRSSDYQIKVEANPPPVIDFRSSAQLGGYTATLSEADVDMLPSGGKVTDRQVAAVHEFGHLLGIKHPGQYLNPPLKIDEDEDYDADRQSLMGRGMEYRPHYFQKWADWMDSNFPRFANFYINDWANRPVLPR